MGPLVLLATVLATVFLQAQIPVLKRSDVVFMYQTDRQTYQDYGGTVVAWGGRPTSASLREARGLKFFGSVGMVTEFSRYYERFPQTYQQGLCRDINGQPFKVPWLTDHQHKGLPYWWCCTRQPLFRQYLSERVADTVQAGAAGVHVDDHLGTAGSLWSGGCFCDRCVAEFRDHLKTWSKEELAQAKINDVASYDFREVVRQWLAQGQNRKPPGHPLWERFRAFQLRDAAKFMLELRALAARTARRPVPMSANACLLWGPHLNDYTALDFFSAEIEHHAGRRSIQISPVTAYRMADAVHRPLASTASGQDWAYIKEHNLPGLVQGWIALSYAAGHSLMVPHHQWCYTTEKGTHWYDGPKEKFAPLFQFVRQNAALFDDHENQADLAVVFAYRTFSRDAAKVTGPCDKLAEANISYRIALGGNDVVDHPLPAEDLRGDIPLLVLEAKDFTPADQKVLTAAQGNRRCFSTVGDALTGVRPAVRLGEPKPVRVFPRIKPGSTVIHLVNWDYDADRDEMRPVRNVRLVFDEKALGITGATVAKCHAPNAAPLTLPITAATVTVPEVKLWAVVELTTDRSQQ